jgi:signal transduction histidine kinase
MLQGVAAMSVVQPVSHSQNERRFSQRSLLTIIAALLILLAATASARYRLSLPTDGRSFYDEPGPGLNLSNNRLLLAVENIPAEAIIRGAVTLRPARPANWQSGSHVRLTYLINEQEAHGYVYLRPTERWQWNGSSWFTVSTIATLLTLVLALVVFFNRPQQLISQLLLLYSVFPLATRIASIPTNGYADVRLADYFYVGAYWPSVLLGNLSSFSFATLLLMLLVFPQPKLPMRRHPRLTVTAVYGLALLTVGISSALPFGAAGLALGWTAVVLASLMLGASVVHSLRTVRDPVERAQVRWLAWPLAGLALFLMLLMASFFTLAFARLLGIAPLIRTLDLLISGLYVSFSLLILLLPLSLAAGIWRDSLFDIKIIVNRTLVYASLTLVIMALYALAVGFFSLLLPWDNNVVLSVLATGIVALLFQPLRRQLQQAVNRMMYGERDDPVTLLARLGRRLAEVTTPSETPQTIVNTLGEVLKLPYAAVILYENGSAVEAAVHGQPPQPPFAARAFPLTYQERSIGELRVGLRGGQEPFTGAEDRLLHNIAQQAGAAVVAAQLTGQLQRSRTRLVAAREEERRRLRRDLHDSLGPQLATLTLKVDAARNFLSHDPQRSEQLLFELKTEIQEALGDIRRLAYELRPPALDQMGLVGALQAYGASLKGSGQLKTTVEARGELPPLPAAVEVAAYRIAVEAMTNVARHAQACTCCVRLQADSDLHLEIYDDGVGLPRELWPGVGLLSMQERAAELGGVCRVERQQRGTRVVARLPLAASAAGTGAAQRDGKRRGGR